MMFFTVYYKILILFSEQDGDTKWKLGGEICQKEKEYLFLYVS